MIKQFGSVSSSPGKTGKYYYSNYFRYYKMDAEYQAFKADDIKEVLSFLSNKYFSGFNVSMPFKQQVIKYLDVPSRDVNYFNSCNTIKVANEKLYGFNTDINGVYKFVSNVSKTDYVILLGNGAMGKTFAKVLTEYGIKFKIISRSLNNWETRHEKCDVLINCTSLGTSLDVSPVNLVNVDRAVFDLAINGMKLKEMSKSLNYMSGLEFYKYVFLEQFFIHTSVSPDPEYFDYLTTSFD